MKNEPIKNVVPNYSFIKTVEGTKYGTTVVLNGETHVKIDLGEPLYRQILEWEKIEGNDIQPYIPPNEVVSFTSEDIRNMFTDDEMDAVEDAIDSGDKVLRRIMRKLSTRLTPMKSTSTALIGAAQYLQSKGLASTKLIEAVLA